MRINKEKPFLYHNHQYKPASKNVFNSFTESYRVFKSSSTRFEITFDALRVGEMRHIEDFRYGEVGISPTHDCSNK